MKDKHPYYKTCPECGAHLAPGERCDCIAGAPPVNTTQQLNRYSDANATIHTYSKEVKL